MSVPLKQRWFEDYTVGEVFEFGDYLVNAEEIVDFARRYELRWLRPVRPGDRLKARVTVLQTRRSHSKPDRGSIVLMQELMDYAGAVVMTQRGRALYRCRRPGTSTLAARESKLT